MARFKPKRCIILLTLTVGVLFMMRTMLMIGEVSSDDRKVDDFKPKKKSVDAAQQFRHEGEEGVAIERPPINHDLGFQSPVQQGTKLKNVLGNYEPDPPPPREGPGENGVPVKTKAAEATKVEEKIKEYGFNQYVSDLISLDRNIPDLRNPQCKYWHYPEKLPTTSVIIVFHNEGWSTLMRTVHSVWNRTPPELLEEIVLVDDFSTKAHLKQKLDDYAALPKWRGKMIVKRNSKREGLIRTRIIGAKQSKGEVLLWLDAHCEVGINWLPPLLAPIAQNRTTSVCPIIDVIDNQSYKLYPQGTGDQDRGGFDWSLYWKHFPLPQFEKARRKYETEPYKSPAMAGGLFAMDKKFFFELGAYDEGLEIWGGENFELSFKIWMCGGELLWVPCSRVGHVYRILGRVPYSAPNGSMLMLSERVFFPEPLGLLRIEYLPDVELHQNLKRVVEVWFDDYKEYFYRSKPEALLVSPGNIEKQLLFRKTHNCKNFGWFMSEIAPDIVNKYPLPAANIHWGEVRAQGTHLCVDSMGQKDGGKIGISYCHGAGGNQLFRVTEDGQFRIHDQCAYDKSSDVRLRRCEVDTKYNWLYNEDTHQLTVEDKMLCLDHTPSSKELSISACDSTKSTQRWEITSKNLRHG